MDFLPTDYEVPSQKGGYMKFKQGDNRFRILSSAIIGFEGWTPKPNSKPLRWRMTEDAPMSKITDEPKHFWAFAVWNYDQEAVVILEITQKGIMKSIDSYVKNKKWGQPQMYDIIVNRIGEGLETEYSVTVDPKEDLDKSITSAYEKMKINLEALYDGEDPFAAIATKDKKKEDQPGFKKDDSLPF